MEKTRTIIAVAVLWAMPWLFCAQAANPPLPSLETLFERVIERAQLEEAGQNTFKQCYRYTRTRVTEYRNANGDVKKRKAKTRINDPSLVPIVYQTPRKAESERSATQEEKLPASDAHANIRGKAFEKSDFPLNEELLKRFDFTLAGREWINGRPVLVVEFKPASRKPPERGIKDRFINKAAGRVWIDETDYALAKADLHLSEKVNVGGGLVGAVSKFTFSIQRERTPEGIWFIREQEWHLEGREVWVRRKVDHHEEYKGVRKVHEPARFSSVDASVVDD
jgi:hypothetical protein